MHRRALLAGAAAGFVTPLAGCLGHADGSDNETDDSSDDAGDDISADASDKASDAGDDAPEPTGEWVQFQGDAARTGATTAVGPDDGGRVRWWSDTTGISTAPVIEDGTVYAGGGLRNQSIFAFDQATGDRLWQEEIGDSIDDIERTLAVDDGTVYAPTDDVYALDAETGTEQWHEPVDTVWGLAFADDTVFAAAGGGGPIVAIDETTGEKRWRRDIHTNTPPSVADGRVFAVGNGELVVLDAESGDTEWRETIDRAGGPPTIADGTVFVGTRDGLFAHDATTGEHEWTLDGSFRNTDIAARDGTLYLAGRQEANDTWISRAIAVDAATGDIEWTQDDDDLGAGSAAVTEECVYVATRYRVYALDRETGDVEWWLRFQWPVSSPAVADGELYVTVGGRLLAIESGDGRAGVWKSDAEPLPDRDATPPEPSYDDADFSFGITGFDVSSEWDVTVDEDAPMDVSFTIDGDRVDEDETVSITLAVTNDGDEALRTTTGAPKPFGILTLQSDTGRITPWTSAYDESGYVHTAPHRGVTLVNSIGLSTVIPPGETVNETYTISEETHGIQPGTYEFSIAHTLSPGDFGDDRDGWQFEVTGAVDVSARDTDEGDVVHDLAVADEVSLPEEFTGGLTVDVLEPVTDVHPGMIEVTFENVTDERSQFMSMRHWPFGSYVGLGPEGRRLVLFPADTYAPGFVEQTDDGWWEPTVLPHESVTRGRSTTSYDPDETSSQRFIVTSHPETDAPRDGDSYAFEQGFGDDNADVTWGFALSTLDPDRVPR